MSKCLISNISKENLIDFKCDYSYLTPKDLDVEMKDLVLESNKIESKLPISFPFVYFFDYEEEQMKEMSKYFKDKGITPIFCANTRANLLWTLRSLLDELMKEHNTFCAINTLQELIKKVMQLPANENKEVTENLLMKSFMILQNKDLNQMNEMIHELTQLLRDHMKDA